MEAMNMIAPRIREVEDEMKQYNYTLKVGCLRIDLGDGKLVALNDVLSQDTSGNFGSHNTPGLILIDGGRKSGDVASVRKKPDLKLVR